MKKVLTLIVSLAIAVSLSACGERVTNAIRGNGNGCNTVACTNPPAPCNYDILSGKCK